MILSIISKCRWSRVLPMTVKYRTNQLRFMSDIRKLSPLHKFYSSDTEFEGESDFFDSDVTKLGDLRQILYPGTEDLIIQKLNRMSSLNEIVGFLQSSVESLSKDQLIQALLILSDLKNADDSSDENITQNLPNFHQVVNRIEEHIDSMTLQELISCYICLFKLEGKNLGTPTISKITNRVRKEMKKNGKLPLVYLARYSFPFNQNRDLNAMFLAVEILPQLMRHLEDCASVEDLNYLTISLNNVSHLINLEMLEKYKTKVQEILDTSLLNSTTSTSCILRIISLLNCHHWSHMNDKLIRNLSLELEECIPTFETRHLMTLHRAFQIHLESAKIQRSFVKRAQELIEVNPTVELLSLAVLHISPDQRTKIANMVKGILMNYQISSASTSDTLQMVFKILRLLKISDISLCDSFWIKCLNQIYGTKVQGLRFKISQFVNKYMFFNNNLGGTYRNIEFEKSVIEMLKSELKTPTSPREFAVFASFIIAYDDENEIPTWIVEKIECLNEQFSTRDSWQLSRGLQILQEMRLKQFISPKLADQIGFINYSLEKCGRRHMLIPDLHLSAFNKILRSYIIRKAPRETSFFHEMLRFYDRQTLPLNSRTIREIAFNLNSSNFRNDSVCDQMVEYVLENWEHVTGDTIEKILTCCYNFSYFPEKLEFFERCGEIISRDFNYMSGLSIIQGLLALVFYKSCPQAILTKVFSQGFIKRLEQEIEMSYSKNTYPQRVMSKFMELNRAACLDCPEINVKWFQQSFIEAQISKMPAVTGKIQKDMKELLLKIVKYPECVNVNHVTPYGYRIDFELFSDKYNRFLKIPPENFYHKVPEFNKVAILILSSRVFCDNDMNRLKGAELLRMRHLEMLGYRVIHIKSSDFNLIYKNFSSKMKYLKSLLQIESK